MRLATEDFGDKDGLVFSNVTFGSVVTSPVLDEGPCFQINNAAELTAFTPVSELYCGVFRRSSNWAGNTGYFRWLFDANTLGDIRWNTSTRKLELRIGSTLVLTGSKVFTDNTSYHLVVRMKIANSGGVIQVWVGGALDIDYSSQDTQPGSDTTINKLVWFNNNNDYIDSLWLNDTSGSENNGNDGIVRILSKEMTGDGAHTAWSKSTGSTGYTLVDEVPYNTTDYVYSQTAGEKITFIPASLGLPANATVLALSGRHVIEKVSSGQVKGLFRVGSTDYPTSAVDAATSYGLFLDRRTQDPSTSAPWAYNAAPEIGLEMV